MVAEIQSVDQSRSFKSLRYDDPLVIGAGALVLGFVIGSGRWDWFGRGLTQVASSLGSYALNSLSESFQNQNPHLFDRRKVS